ncbi:hypothetical protein ACFL2Y_01615 [Candidatus Omnitrophota bacterium]
MEISEILKIIAIISVIVVVWYIRKRFPSCGRCGSDGIEGSLIDKFPNLKPISQLKFGHLYKCSKCGTSWFLYEHKRWLDRIREEFLPFVQVWNQGKLTIDVSILNALASIGGVESYYKDYITIPCSVRDASGQCYEKANVFVSKFPPIRWPKTKLIHWSNDLVSVSPSPFALPIAVRRASAEKKEESMGFAPVGIVDKNGTEYTLICQTEFFNKDGIKGEDIKLSGRQGKWKKIVKPKEETQAVYFVDWFDKCEEILCPHQREEVA